jgi:hypothetical protein
MYKKLRIAPFQIVQKKQLELLVIREPSGCALHMVEDHDVRVNMMTEQIVQKALKILLAFVLHMEEDHDVSSKMMTGQIVHMALEDLLDFAKDMEEDHDVSSKMRTEQIVQKAH